MAKGRKRKQGKRVEPQRAMVSPERAAKGKFASVGMALKLIPMIDQLLKTESNPNGILNEREHKALGYYRDQASLAEHSPVKSCLDFTPGGGRGPGMAIISAQRETHRMERDMGTLASLVRAVAVDDCSLADWCASRFGSGFDRSQIGIAAMELKYAAGSIIEPLDH